MHLQPPDLFASRYRLVRKIGIGGFSEVWLAADELADNLKCAIKIYAPERGLDEGGLRQFRKEYTVTAHLQHSNLLKASHFDIHNGSPYLVFPYCSRGSLAGLLQDRETLTEKEIAEVVYQVADALAYIHDKGVLHQDVKPDNVLINDEGRYLITDFGISSRMRSTLRKSTTTGKALTVAYAPPERFVGAQVSDASGDVFSLGVMIFELATGDVPWMGGGGSVLKADSPLPTLPQFSKELEKVMQQCMQYTPQARPTAVQLKAAAAHYLKQGYWLMEEKKRRVTEAIPKQEQSEASHATMVLDQANESTFRNWQAHTKHSDRVGVESSHSKKINYQKLALNISISFKLYMLLYYTALLVVLVSVLTIEPYNGSWEVDNYEQAVSTAIAIFFVLFGVSLVFFLITLNRAWRSIQNDGAFTTPEKAVGYLFIPFYNIYWTFVAFRRLFLDTKKIVKSANEGFATAVCIISVIPVLNYLGFILYPVLMTQIKNNAVKVCEIKSGRLNHDQINKNNNYNISLFSVGLLITLSLAIYTYLDIEERQVEYNDFSKFKNYEAEQVMWYEEDGKLYIEGLADEIIFVEPNDGSYNIDYTKDFIFEIEVEDENSANVYGIYIEGYFETKLLLIEYGHYNTVDWVDEEVVNVGEWTRHESINLFPSNRLSVKRVNDLLTIYVNDAEIYTIEDHVTPNDIGLVINGKASIKVTKILAQGVKRFYY